tara:strand:- start:171 stop:383 length:213 start_codon:yes stop_codon:yes gene_type:complete
MCDVERQTKDRNEERGALFFEDLNFFRLPCVQKTSLFHYLFFILSRFFFSFCGTGTRPKKDDFFRVIIKN